MCAICPKCNEEIESLVNFKSGENRSIFSLIEFGKGYVVDYDDRYFYDDEKTNDFECPECNEVLFIDEEQAKDFLEGKTELQRIVAEKINQINENERRLKNGR